MIRAPCAFTTIVLVCSENFPLGISPETVTGTFRITRWLRRRLASGPDVDHVFTNSQARRAAASAQEYSHRQFPMTNGWLRYARPLAPSARQGRHCSFA